ncbi:type III glutamate--ammonia ligase [Synechococcus sp. Nb3U1]|uniref:type III glutamate--ammonia ligase n=1 Tax=Synechococcus sp. Nb3U1 TaxID=1914529 RepID=UPI001F1D6592|nr:type III glutamate--ammonia ligase [Synechococcus sp. Nb3U1]MCF2971694.1 type III glutamate--ammonia ligase [Synechococcus sp. Nb3U1]
MTQLLSETARTQGIDYFLLSFTDLFGIQRAKLVPTSAIDAMADGQAGFAGFAAWLDLTPADPDVFAQPDRERLYQLPWQPELGWMPADLIQANGDPLEQTPRWVLKRVLAQAEAMGLRAKTGVECEFMLFSPEEWAVSDPRDQQAKPCYDQQSLMRRFSVIRDICDGMQKLGWNPYQNDHEDANGQFEMNWLFDDALVTADRHAFFKYMVKSIAEQQGYRATFMPKPFPHLTGNGCHTHISLWDPSGTTNLFTDATGELGLSKLAYHFIAGVLHHAPALCALTNPTVNSYRRLNAPVTLSGATWSPSTISYSGNNRTHTIRIPDGGRFELRLADASANPYLLTAGLIAAGLDGIQQQRDPGPRSDNNTYTAPTANAPILPGSLHEALDNLAQSSVLRTALGDPFVNAYLKLKRQQWQEFSHQITPWERETTLDC